MKNITTKTVAIGIAIMLIYSASTFGAGLNPRAIGMGGAYTALARGFEAPAWNPANLGLSDGEKLTMNFFGTGAAVKNNSLSLSDYNRYSGKLLTEEDEDELINSIPANGMAIDFGIEASALNISLGNFALTQRVYGLSSLTVDKDPLKLMLLGNAVLREVHVTDTQGESFAIADMAASYGQAIRRWQGGELCLGASVHYLRGLAYGKVVETQGGVSLTDTGFAGAGLMRIRTSLGGSGYSMDIGAAVRFEDTWFFSAAWKNMAGKIKWNRDNEEYLTWFVMQPITAEDFFLDGQSDSLVISDDTSYATPGFASRPAPALSFGLARKYRNLSWSLDWQQALFDEPGININPRVAGGIEYIHWLFLPLRSGMAFGGGQGTVYSVGFGLYSGPYHFDLGVANSGSPMPANSKGLRIGIAMGLYFQ